jgi:DNA repair exonuclease SbcCD ATPase subunit
MSRFTDAERATIRRESERLLRDPPARPEPAPPREVHVPEVDPVQEWREWHDARDREREANRAANRRQADDPTLAGFAAIGSRLDALEERMAAVEQALAGLNALANGAAQFSNATVARLEELAACANKAGLTFETVRALHERQVEHLRNRLAASEAASARESAFLGRQLAEARRELDALHGKVDRERDRERTDTRLSQLAENLDNVVAYQRRDPAVS